MLRLVGNASLGVLLAAVLFSWAAAQSLPSADNESLLEEMGEHIAEELDAEAGPAPQPSFVESFQESLNDNLGNDFVTESLPDSPVIPDAPAPPDPPPAPSDQAPGGNPLYIYCGALVAAIVLREFCVALANWYAERRFARNNTV